MPRNATTGVYTLPIGAFVAGGVIKASDHNANYSDIATALSQSIAATGISIPTSPIPFTSGASVSTPGVTHVTDKTSGLYNPTTGQEALVSGGNGLLVNSLAYYCSAAVVAAGGTNYAVGDRIPLAGGTSIAGVVLTVATLSGSAVATVTITNPGRYTAQPTNPVSQSSSTGSGTGATFTLTFTAAQVITDATGTNIAQALGISPYAANTLLKLASASDLTVATGITYPTTVPQGGLGTTTLVPYAPVVGGTTTTGNAQSVASVGTSGQRLTSNGPGALPTYQTPPQPPLAKAWASIDGNNGNIFSSYNVASVVRASAGLYNVTFTTPFSSVSYTVTATAGSAGIAIVTLGDGSLGTIAPTVSTIQLRVANASNTPLDVFRVYFTAFGAQ